MKISCSFCDWVYEVKVPGDFNEGVFQCGAHYARNHDGLLDAMRNFSLADLEKLHALPDTRQNATASKMKPRSIAFDIHD